MKIRAKQGRLGREPADLALIGFFEREKTLGSVSRELSPALAGQARAILQSKEFEGKHLQLSVIRSGTRAPLSRVMLVGLGKRRDCSLERIRQAAGRAVRQARDLGCARLSAVLFAGDQEGTATADWAQAMAEGAVLGLYRFHRYKTEGKESKKSVKQLVLLDPSRERVREIQEGVHRGQVLAEATILARDLGNSPANDATPTRIAEIAQEMARENGLKCEVLGRRRMESLGMGAILGVSRGSQEPPQFIILNYQGAEKKIRPVALIGKTVTFDSGGISLKPSTNMDQMKMDMMGGAAVLGALKAVAQLKLPVNVVGFLPATENMPSGTAVKPGDVIRTLSGKTVEVANTDAEGRLILADALSFAARYQPAAMVDLATLTGACTVALGHHAIGLLGNHNQLLDAVKESGTATGERVWELPLWEEYYDQIKSDIADIRNIGRSGAGTITAAAFLSKFVDGCPWAHLDIASTAWTDENRPYAPKGATGIGVRLLVRLLAFSETLRELCRKPALRSRRSHKAPA